MTAGRRTGATPPPPTRCARRILSGSSRGSARSRGRAGPRSLASGSRSPAARPPPRAPPSRPAAAPTLAGGAPAWAAGGPPRGGLAVPCRPAGPTDQGSGCILHLLVMVGQDLVVAA